MNQYDPMRPRGFALDKQNKKLLGVCAGIGNYFGLDVTLVRIAFALGTLLGFGAPALIYFTIALIAN